MNHARNNILPIKQINKGDKDRPNFFVSNSLKEAIKFNTDGKPTNRTLKVSKYKFTKHEQHNCHTYSPFNVKRRRE